MYRLHVAAVVLVHAGAMFARPAAWVSRTDIAFAVQPAMAQGDRYRDPNGRFSVMIPAGWTASAQAGGVVIGNGAVTAVFSPFNGASSGRDVISVLSRQFESQWRNLHRMDQGDFMIAGHPASYMVFSGNNPQGTSSVLRLAGFTDGREAYAVIMSAPNDQFNATSRTLQAIEQSFTIGSGAAPASGAAPMRDAPQSGGGALGIRGTIGFNGASNTVPVTTSGQLGATLGGVNVASGDRAVLGVITRDVETADLPRLGINERLGALIVQIAPGSAADRAQLVAGDLILSADRQTIRQHVDLQRVVQGHRLGESVELIVMRQGRPLTIQVPFR